MEKIAWDGPKWGQEDFFPTNPDLADILAERIWNLKISTFFILWTPTFWISRSPDFPNLAWAGPGLDLGGGGEMLASQFHSGPLCHPCMQWERFNKGKMAIVNSWN